MKKSQVSFEFILLFLIVFIIFVLIISYFPGWLERTNSTKDKAEKIAKDVKVRAITASLSHSNYQSEMKIPNKIDDIGISLELFPDPDNILKIKNKDSGASLAKAFLPKINQITGTQDGLTLTIIKEDNILTIARS